MKVLIIGGGKPNRCYPLNGNFEFDQAIALSASGLDVIYFAIDLRSLRRKRSWGISHGKEQGVEWYEISLPIGAIPLSLLCIIGAFAAKILFRKVFNNKDYPNVIHAHFTNIGCMAASLSKMTGIPLVITEHSSFMNHSEVPADVLKCAKKGYSQASKVIAVSNPLRDSIIRNTSVDSIVIQNMIRLESFTQSIRQEHKGFNIVSVGGFIHRKRFSNLIRAFADVKKKHDDIFLHIIGDGPLKDDLLSLSNNLSINNSVTYYGYKDSDEIASIFGRCDCFALATECETFGVVYVEAMAAGLPVIATRCGGPEDFVNEKNGILIDVDNHQQLCDAIEYMYLNASSYNADEIKHFAIENFSPSFVANKIIEVYNGVFYQES